MLRLAQHLRKLPAGPGATFIPRLSGFRLPLRDCRVLARSRFAPQSITPAPPRFFASPARQLHRRDEHLTQRKSVALQAVAQVTQYLRVPRLVSIRSRILALAVLGTVIPAGISLGVAYSQNRRAREEKITQDLVSQSTQTARAMGVWLKERIYDLRVFASSDEVSNNLN